MNLGTYDFVSKVFNLPSSRSIANYDLVDGSTKDDVLYNMLRILEVRLKDCMMESVRNGEDQQKIEWIRYGSLSFNSISIKK